MVTYSKESEAAAAVTKFNKTEIRAGHVIQVSIANFDSNSHERRGSVPNATAPSTSRWGAQKTVNPAGIGAPPTTILGKSGLLGGAPTSMLGGGLTGILPGGINPNAAVLSKQQQAAQKAAEIAKQIESLKSVLGKK